MDFYESGYLRLWNTNGFELSKDRNVTTLLENIKGLVKHNESKGPDQYIHCIWYCISGNIFEKDEEEIIKLLINTFEEAKIPIIILYLKAIIKEDIEKIEKKIKKLFKHIDFIPVRAKEMKTDEQFISRKKGLNEIIEKTILRFKSSVTSISFQYIENKINKNIKKKLENFGDFNDINISKSLYELFKNLFGDLDKKYISKIDKSVEDIKILFKELDFKTEISNNFTKFKMEFNRRNKININITDDEEIDIISNELEFRFKICKNNPNININVEIYNYFLNIIKDIIVNKIFKSIKDDIKEKLKKNVQESSNFKELLNKYN